MSVLDDPNEYKNNWLFDEKKRIYGDFSTFYITVAICTVFGAFLLVLNVYLCCCSKYQEYWKDRNTGNLWILPLWTKTPHKQPPLDLTELERNYVPPPPPTREQQQPIGYIELQKRESDL